MAYSNIFDSIYKQLKQENKWLSPREIQNVRKNYSLTQKHFAKILGISFGTYKNWEIGHRIPTSPAMALLYVAKDHPNIFLKNKKKLLTGLARKHC